MLNNVILHNPRCAKSRETLNILNENNIDLKIIEYLKHPPSIKELDYICSKLGLDPKSIVRSKEKLFSELGLSITDNKSNKEWLKILNENPKLIERPIVIIKNRAVIGRPPEKVLEIV